MALAGHMKLSKLIFLYDDNGITIDGPLTLSDNVDQVKRFKAHGWNAVRASTATTRPRSPPRFTQAQTADRPSMIACKTTIGFGAPTKAGTSKAHGERSAPKKSPAPRRRLGWNYGPFEIPEHCCRPGARRRQAGRQRPCRLEQASSRRSMELQNAPNSQRRVIDRKRPAKLADAVAQAEGKTGRRSPKGNRHPQGQRIRARRAGPGAAGNARRLGRSHASNNTRTKGLKEVDAGRFQRPLHPLRHPRARAWPRP
jgi:transketolase